MTARVSASEAAMLRAVRWILTGSGGELRPLSEPPTPIPTHIGPTAMDLLKRTLQKGTIIALARHGAWRPRKTHTQGHLRTGRLWHHHPELCLRFSPASYSLCRWLIFPTHTSPQPPETVADELLFYLTADAFVRLRRSISLLASSSLVWLGFLDHLDRNPDLLDLSRFVSGDGAIILLALQGHLETRYVAMEKDKTRIEEPDRLVALGQRQQAVLTAFFDAIEAANRQDLATFAVRAAAKLTHRPTHAWISGMARTGAPMSKRAEASRQSATFLRSLGRIATWRRALSTVPFFDDDYDRAQTLVTEWEPLGLDGFNQTQAMADALESLRAFGDTGKKQEETP